MKYWLFFLLALPLIMLGIKPTAHADRAVPVVDSLELGRLNAVKKAHQMTDLPIYPVSTLYAYKGKTYKQGKKETGVIYSSAKELDCFVGQDVSIHTFMTALHNPRSVLYTERIDKPPYHGRNCGAYYGTVCSGLVNYALGISVTQRSADILASDDYELIKDQSARGIRIADLICKNGHPRLVTGIDKNSDGSIKSVEISVAANTGCRRYIVEGEKAFNELLKKNNYQIYRYKYLSKNLLYKPANEFVAVEGENLASFVYNDDICANKGDKSCYISGEKVVLNLAKGYDKVEVYKDSKLYKTISIGKQLDIILKDLPYGDYRARVVNEGKNQKSDYTYWKVIDVNVRIDEKNNRICFYSANAKPVYYEFCNISGGRPSNKSRVYAAEFTERERRNGYVDVNTPGKPIQTTRKYPYVKVHFECDYGRVINNPIKWFE